MGVYKDVIVQALVIFPVIACLFTMPYVIYNYHKYGSVLSLRILIVYSFILYLLCAYFLVILPLPSKAEVAAMTGPRAQLVPFQFIGDILKESHISLSDPASWLSLISNKAFLQVLFNVVMTVPFGMYLRYYFRCGLKKTLLFSFLLSLFFELTQLSGLYFIYPRGYRLFDVDDLLANTLGGISGYFMAAPLQKMLPAREELDQASFRRGREVSLFRRVLAFGIDLPFAGIAGLLLSVLIPGNEQSKGVLLFSAYFVLLPMIWNGTTIGKKVMRIRIVSETGEKAAWHQLLIRAIGLWALLYFVPYLTAAVGSIIADDLVRLAFCGLLCGVWFFFLLFELDRMAMHRRLFYERLSGTREISTVVEKSDDRSRTE